MQIDDGRLYVIFKFYWFGYNLFDIRGKEDRWMNRKFFDSTLTECSTPSTLATPTCLSSADKHSLGKRCGWSRGFATSVTYWSTKVNCNKAIVEAPPLWAKNNASLWWSRTSTSIKSMKKLLGSWPKVTPHHPIHTEFLIQNNIDFVCHDEDPYPSLGGEDAYALAKRLGKFQATQRTKGISTTDIVAKILRNKEMYYARNLNRGVSR